MSRGEFAPSKYWGSILNDLEREATVPAVEPRSEFQNICKLFLREHIRRRERPETIDTMMRWIATTKATAFQDVAPKFAAGAGACAFDLPSDHPGSKILASAIDEFNELAPWSAPLRGTHNGTQEGKGSSRIQLDPCFNWWSHGESNPGPLECHSTYSRARGTSPITAAPSVAPEYAGSRAIRAAPLSWRFSLAGLPQRQVEHGGANRIPADSNRCAFPSSESDPKLAPNWHPTCGDRVEQGGRLSRQLLAQTPHLCAAQ